MIVSGTIKIDDESIDGASRTVKLKSNMLFIAIGINKFFIT